MNKQLRYRLEDGAAAVVQAAASVLPRRLVMAVGGALGRIVGGLDRRHIAIAVDNMRRAFPDWTEQRLLRTARDVYRHFGAVALEILWLAGRPAEQVLPLIEIRGQEHFQKALAAGKGVVLPSAHIGNWEITALAHAWTQGPMGMVARPLDNPGLEQRLWAVRSQAGSTIINKGRALGQILSILRSGGCVGILIDQNVQERDGIFVDFFSRPAATTTVAAALAVKTGCAVVPGHTQRLPDGRYRMTYEPALQPSGEGDRRADIVRLTQLATRRVEEWVRESPEQWLWMHRRWHTRPQLSELGGGEGSE